MKKTLLFLSLLLGLFVFSVSLISCSEDDIAAEKQAMDRLVGTWTVQSSTLNVLGLCYGDEIIFEKDGTFTTGNEAGTYIYDSSNGEFTLTIGEIAVTGVMDLSGKIVSLTYTMDGNMYEIILKQGSSDEQPGSDAEGNTTDVAVTGIVCEVGPFYAQVEGVVNLNLITEPYTDIEIGVEVSSTQDFSEKTRMEATELEERMFNVRVSILEPETKYYYRTYVSVPSLSEDYYGETYSFTTSELASDFAVTGDVEEVGVFYAQIDGSVNLSDLETVNGSAKVGIEVSESEDFSSPRRMESSMEENNSINCLFTGLKPSTNYYYRTYVTVNFGSVQQTFYGDANSFATTALVDDFAVTGEVKEVGVFYAHIDGSVNLADVAVANGSAKVGVEVSESESFSSPRRMESSVSENGVITCRFTGLKPGIDYYYRTYVIAKFGSVQQTFYGDVNSFTTTALVDDFVVTGEVKDFGATIAVIGGSANPSDVGVAGGTVTVGIEISTATNFSGSSKLNATYSPNGFTCRFTELKPETMYYYRTYVIATFGSIRLTFYGDTKSFTTMGFDNSNHYVDLGLPSSTLWGTKNVGAEEATEYGNYYAWGETSPKESYTTSSYFDKSYTKYNPSGRTELLPEDDAATVNWGTEWCMPTKEQLNELCSQCVWKWITQNGVKGYVVSSKTNCNSIFLPATGYRHEGSLYYVNLYGFYWSRTLYLGESGYAWDMDFSSSSISMTYYYNRYYGRSVRPVRNQ